MSNMNGETTNRHRPKKRVQVKVYADAAVAASFKSDCIEKGVSMSDRIEAFMSGENRTKTAADSVETRRRRRKAVGLLAKRLEDIIRAETDYMGRIPANLRDSAAYAAAEETIEALEQALGFLGEAYWYHLDRLKPSRRVEWYCFGKSESDRRRRYRC